MYLIGADMTLQRLRHAIEVLGGVSKKKPKNWKNVIKHYQTFNPIKIMFCIKVRRCGGFFILMRVT